MELESLAVPVVLVEEAELVSPVALVVLARQAERVNRAVVAPIR